MFGWASEEGLGLFMNVRVKFELGSHFRFRLGLGSELGLPALRRGAMKWGAATADVEVDAKAFEACRQICSPALLCMCVRMRV